MKREFVNGFVDAEATKRFLNDLIPRVDAFINTVPLEGTDPEIAAAYRLVGERILKIPAVDPHKHGRIVPKKIAGCYRYLCSECNGTVLSHWNYCPLCGAKFDKEVADESN